MLCNSFLYTNNIQKYYSVSRCVISIIIVIAPTRSVCFFLVNENEEEEVEVGANYKSISIGEC